MILKPGPGKAPKEPEKKKVKMRGSVNLDSLARNLKKRPLSMAAAWMRSVRDRLGHEVRWQLNGGDELLQKGSGRPRC